MIPGMRALQKELDDKVNKNGCGVAKSHEEYRYNCGVIAGMKRAIEVLKAPNADQLNEDD